MSRIDRLVYQRPALVVTILLAIVLLPLWWLTGDFSPLP
jgi:hypothetical protein